MHIKCFAPSFNAPSPKLIDKSIFDKLSKLFKSHCGICQTKITFRLAWRIVAKEWLLKTYINIDIAIQPDICPCAIRALSKYSYIELRQDFIVTNSLFNCAFRIIAFILLSLAWRL